MEQQHGERLDTILDPGAPAGDAGSPSWTPSTTLEQFMALFAPSLFCAAHRVPSCVDAPGPAPRTPRPVCIVHAPCRWQT